MELNENEYLAQFPDYGGGIEDETPIKSKRRIALDRAWKNRDFEISLYWKRATYFWGFIAAAFAGYALLSIDQWDLKIVLICLGLIFSFAWVLVNIGSKKWQQNWEKHIDMLEDDVSGPIYKTVLQYSGYSVSKINLLVSKFVLGIWVLMLLDYFLKLACHNKNFNDLVNPILCTIMTIVFFFVIFKQSKKEAEFKPQKNEKRQDVISFELRSNEYRKKSE